MRLSGPGLFCTCFLNLVEDVTSIVPPSKDSWYFQPNDIGRYANGEVIRSRHVAPQLESFISLPVNVSVKTITQYLFRTTDNLGHAVASAATLIEPFNADSTKLLGYQTFYDSASVDCSPSYTIRAKKEESVISKLNVSLDIALVRINTMSPFDCLSISSDADGIRIESWLVCLDYRLRGS